MDAQPVKPDINHVRGHEPGQPLKLGMTQKIRGQPVRRIVLDSSIIVLSILFFAASSPRGTPSLVLLAGFLAIAASSTAAFDLILWASSMYDRIALRYRRILYLLIAIVPAFLLLLQSLGQLSARDAAVIVLVMVVGVFYVGRQGRPASPRA